MKKIIIVTGGAGFIGSNLINFLIKKTKYNIISIDNYSSGSRKNHIKNKRIRYINSHTKNISKVLNTYKKKLFLFFILENLQEFFKAFLR
tara:strand:+ start:659 stop:928 length:270 start_codon:yes stop_codon:yes gene_type:complete